ncbi:MAG TPA: hypothetical protein VGX72_01000 [Solirubrobacteraceae bacterium]|nr:hypothetical protein [Solirubrobacteraceae bacterium]
MHALPAHHRRLRGPTRAGRARPLAGAVLAALLIGVLGGCGAGTPAAGGPHVNTPTKPAYVTEPFTAEQKLVVKGSRLVVADGCAACHLDAKTPGLAPDFITFAGHHVSLADGRSVLVDESFVRAGLLHPEANEVKGYEPGPMLAAVARLHLSEHPAQVAALAAFIEQVGPETE